VAGVKPSDYRREGADDLAQALGFDTAPRVAGCVFELEFDLFEGPVGHWREHYGKGKGRVESPTGEASCAEAELVRILREGDWHAGWLEDYQTASIPQEWQWALVNETDLPPNVSERHKRIREELLARFGLRGGCWDVIAWKGDALWYLETKGPKDGLSRNQIAWWATGAALDPAIRFAVVVWRPRKP
jgi:hypothetical protein